MINDIIIILLLTLYSKSSKATQRCRRIRLKLALKFNTHIAWQVYAIDIKRHLFLRVLWLLNKTLNIAHKLLLLWYFYDVLELESPWVTVCYYWMEKSSLDIPLSPLVFHGRKRSYRFGTTWGWVNDDRIFIFKFPFLEIKFVRTLNKTVVQKKISVNWWFQSLKGKFRCLKKNELVRMVSVALIKHHKHQSMPSGKQTSQDLTVHINNIRAGLGRETHKYAQHIPPKRGTHVHPH